MNNNNNITIGSANNSQIQQDTKKSHQNVNKTQIDSTLEDFLENFIRDISKIEDPEASKSLTNDVEIIKRQSTSSNPDRGIIKDCLLSIKNILEGATGNVLASYIPAVIPLLARL